jgi:hypothetical protein
VDRLGRHNIVGLGQLLGGGACLACAMVSGGTTQAVLAGIGKFGCSGVATCVWTSMYMDCGAALPRLVLLTAGDVDV